MSVCLTKKQAEFFKVISKYRDEHGYYPDVTQVAKILNKKPISIISFYGSLFLRGVFSDGKPQTRYHAEAHTRVDAARQRAIRAAETRRQRAESYRQRQAATAQPQQMGAAQKRRVAEALVKLLSGEGGDTNILSEIAGLMR